MHRPEAIGTNNQYGDWVRIGYRHQENGAIAEAITAYEEAIDKRNNEPLSYGVHLNLANCYRHQTYLGDTNSAVDAEYHYGRALDASAHTALGQAQTLLERSTLFIALGDSVRAEEDLFSALHALKQVPYDPVQLAMRELVLQEIDQCLGHLGVAANPTVQIDMAEVINFADTALPGFELGLEPA